MEYRRLGSSGLKLSALSFGSWITFTKLFWGGSGPNDEGLSRKHILEGLDASLARLQLSYVDLIFCHRPDRGTPVEETVRAMNHVIAQGKALYWGTSEWSADEIMEAYSVARREHLIPPQMEQPEYNMFQRQRVEREYARLYGRIGLGLTTFSPLASGFLTGKYDQGMPMATRAGLPREDSLRTALRSDLVQGNIARATSLAQPSPREHTFRPQVALAESEMLAWTITAITGASRP